MARWEPEQTVTQSVLDRLIDREPASRSEAALTRAQSVRQLKVSLRRDLEWLLNSRRTPDAVGSEFQELEQSLYNFGLPDVTSLSWDSARDRGRLARMIEQVLDMVTPYYKHVVESLAQEGHEATGCGGVRWPLSGALLRVAMEYARYS